MQRELSPQLFVLFRSVIEDRAGLQYQLADKSLLRDRLWTRASDRGFTTLLDYYYFIRYDPAGDEELEELLEELVVSETYFFRELEPLRVAVEEILLPLATRGVRPRVWSAACATGEEPLTLAMLLESRGVRGDRAEIVATDISTRALERARSGKHGRRSLRREIPEFARPWIELQGEVPRVDAMLRERIRWQRLNLLDERAISLLGSFDLILCRNVLIYFSEDTVRRVIASLTRVLNTGGVLLVGVSESLLRFGSSLALEEKCGVSFYRKVSAHAP